MKTSRNQNSSPTRDALLVCAVMLFSTFSSQAKVTGAGMSRVSSVQLLQGRTASVEVSFPGEAIYPESLRRASRKLNLLLTGPGWNQASDWSADGLLSNIKLRPCVPLFNGGKLVGGSAP